MLKTRIVTAVLLLIVFLYALIELPMLGWVGFASIVAALGAWEWGGLMRWGRTSRVLAGVVFILVCALVGNTHPAALGLSDGFSESALRLGFWFYLPAAVFWVFAVPAWLRFRWRLPNQVFGTLVGVLLLLPTWLALIQLRQFGAVQVVAVMAVVWIADTAAYFFGRLFGRRKLAPEISPGKTWEGACGGVFAVVIYGFALSPWLPDTLTRQPLLLLAAMLALAALSIIGDLYESLLKRQAGIKDSSNILPGHGGVLDRIDSLTSTLPIVALIWLLASG